MDLHHLFTELEINETEALINLNDNDWKTKVTFPSRVIRLLENAKKWDPKAIFCFDNKPLILFFENPKDKKELHKAVWNFNETPIVIVIENTTVSIYNGFALDNNKFLERLGGEEILDNFKYFELVTGKTFEKYTKNFAYQNRVDNKLLENIEETQKEFQRIGFTNRKIANALLGKVIFIRYLIDRKVKLNFKNESKIWSNDDFCNLLTDRKQVFTFFEYLRDKKKGFNGNLFHLKQNDFDVIPDEAFNLIKRLLEGDEIKSGQKSLFQLYDFSVLPIEFISNVYERFIGKENQAEAGAYYTPTFLVDYIISQTVVKKLNENKETISCKVLDPACGSGIFLVEALRKIIEKHIAVNGISENSEEFKETIKRLACENIFGIDKDESAIQVAIFSIYLTLLDYQEPPEIATFTFPPLLGTNFFVDDFFDEDANFNTELKKYSFDFIVGNPPWFRGKGEKKEPLYVTYINNRNKKERLKGQPACKIGGKEIAQAFLIRSRDFSDNTENALIVTSKTLYNLKSVDFRTYFLHHFNVKRVFELAPVRREVFDKSNKKAIAPACVLFFKYDKTHNTDNNIIEHITLKPSRFFSLFKIFTINRTDFNKVQQKQLKEYDWLWKVLVYGSYLDFNFIKRLKANYSTIGNIANQEDKYIVKQGLKEKDGNNKNDSSHLVGRDYIIADFVERFYINPNSKKWLLDTVGYIYKKEDIFKAPILLITGGTTNNLKAVSAISYTDAVYKSSLTGIKGKTMHTIPEMRTISGILNSSFFAYYNIMSFSSSGIEREETHDVEKLSVPYCDNNLDKIVFEIEELIKEKNEKTMSNSLLSIKINNQLKRIDKWILNSFDCSSQEFDLINYANNIAIPLAIKHNYEKLFEAIKPSDKLLTDYAQLYINRYSKNLSKNGKKFTIEIWHTNQVIGMFFKVVDESEFVQEIEIKDKQKDSAIIQFLTKVGKQKITEQLFVQKDIRGFDKDQFYIFKPNEKRLWHKAIGYLDVNEFTDAILKSGRDAK